MTAERRLQGIATLVDRHVDPSVPPHVNARSRAAFIASISERRRPPRPLLPFVAVGAVALAPLLALYTLRLRYTAPAATAGVVTAQRQAEQIAFSDGSAITLSRGAELKIAHTDWNRAELVLQRGRVDIDVEHHFYRDWIVRAGPYTVEVTGTRFSLEWAENRLALAMIDGSVRVRGPKLADGRAVAAPETFFVGAPAAVIPAPASPIVSAVPQPAATTTAHKERQKESGTLAPPTPVQPQPAERHVTWAERIAAGQFAEILTEANQLGIAQAVATVPASELSALADAARYSGQRRTAEQALLAIRQRFGGTDRAAMSAFLLGRLAEDKGQSDVAIDWYERYLQEQPKGSFAAEALGRKMVVMRRHNPQRAREIAKQYAARYPGGAHAAVARELLAPR